MQKGLFEAFSSIFIYTYIYNYNIHPELRMASLFWIMKLISAAWVGAIRKYGRATREAGGRLEELFRHAAEIEACYCIRRILSCGEEEGLGPALEEKKHGGVRESATAR